MQLTQGETAFLERRSTPARGRGGGEAPDRGAGATAAPPDPMAARRPLHLRRAARRHHRVPDPHRPGPRPDLDRAPRGPGQERLRRAHGARARARRRSHGLEAVVLEPPYSSIDRAQADAAEGAELVFGTFLMWESMVLNVPAIRTRHGCSWTTSTRPVFPNGVGVSFASEEGSFLVGAAAALESTTGTIGYIGANASPLIEEFRAGFEQGAKFADPDIEVVSHADRPTRRGRLRRVPARRGCPSAGRLAVDGRGGDIVFTAAGLSGSGSDRSRDGPEPPGRPPSVGDRRRHGLPVRAPRVAAQPPADVDAQAPGCRRRMGRRRARGGQTRGPVLRPPRRRGRCGRLLDFG